LCKIGSQYLSYPPEWIILMQIRIFSMPEAIDFEVNFPSIMGFPGAELSEDNGP
jgi:hypothetical protein